MKTICIFNGNMSRAGGTEKCTAFLANALSEKYNIHVIDISNKDNTCFFKLKKSINVNHLKAINLIDGIRNVFLYIVRNKIDVLINVEAMLGIYSVPACKLTNTKVIVWEHGNFYQKQCKNIDNVRSVEMKLCDYYITLTEEDKKNFLNHFNGRCKVEYIYNPVSISDENITYNLNSKTILSVGVVREIKGFDMLIEVAEKVLHKHKDWTWEIYGNYNKDDDYYKSLVKKTKEKKIHDRLLFKGITEDIAYQYKKSAMLVVTSRMEGLPMTMLEAMAYKLPLVSFDIQTGPSEIIYHDINGFLIEPYNIQAMAEKICELIENPELRKRFSNNAYIGIEKFDKKIIIDKWINVLESLEKKKNE